jgi:hypothetical protein
MEWWSEQESDEVGNVALVASRWWGGCGGMVTGTAMVGSGKNEKIRCEIEENEDTILLRLFLSLIIDDVLNNSLTVLPSTWGEVPDCSNNINAEETHIEYFFHIPRVFCSL